MRCRRLSLLLLMMALLWQGLTLGGLGAWLAQGEAALNARLHWQGQVPHHHHEDGRLHQDLSRASLQHALDDAASQAPVLPARAPSLPWVLTAQTLPAPVLPAWTTPRPDAIERPPRQA